MKSPNRNIFFLINSLAGGGAEKVLVRLLHYLKPEKLFLLEKDIAYQIEEEPTLLSSHLKNTNPLLKTFFIPVYAYRLAKNIGENSVVISFLERANFVNVFAKLYKKHKTVISVRTDQVKGHVGFRKFNKLLVKLFYPRADLLIAVSEGVKKSLISLGIEEGKIKVIYNPYPIENIEELAKEDLREWESVFEGPVIITAGRLTKPKGQWYLLRVFRQLKETKKDLKLVILGEGELKEYLVTLSEELGLRTFVWDRDSFSEDFDVYFLGFQKNPFKFIARSKLFVFPSLWEGFPNALVEAMACGVPVVSSDCRSGPREILAPNTDVEYQTEKPEFAEYGVLMPVFDVKFKSAKEPLEEKERMWVEELDRMLRDESLRMEYSTKSKKRAEDFRIERVIHQWMEVLYG
ncbi:glycosyltransferase [Thermodesulfobacterium sp. TA1]|uniref:glycosyltransferase n=1 Tax=Thermodesulfobacterium sp. TA1 TaxID=2234087 RepID=UPI001231C7C7|nr:glycosyltransferase [Thermodesulfobacterium sp. TA1]QER41951.1 glycosyltransferase [Thermodesulfobacterium sp. TA1]